MEGNQHRTTQAFKRNSFVAYQKFSNEYASTIMLGFSQDSNDYFNETFSAKIQMDFFAKFIEERTFTKEFKRPTFFDWLFRRKPKYTFNVKVSEVTKYVPNGDNVLMVEFE